MTLAQRLVEAETAYHALLTGRSVVELRDQNGETIRYTPASRLALLSYINDLKRQVDASSAPSTAPLRVLF
jgi:hypothetical protein